MRSSCWQWRASPSLKILSQVSQLTDFPVSWPERKNLAGPDCAFLWGRSTTLRKHFLFSVTETFSLALCGRVWFAGTPIECGGSAREGAGLPTSMELSPRSSRLTAEPGAGCKAELEWRRWEDTNGAWKVATSQCFVRFQGVCTRTQMHAHL